MSILSHFCNKFPGKPGDQNSESEGNEGSDSEMEDEDQILATYR